MNLKDKAAQIPRLSEIGKILAIDKSTNYVRGFNIQQVINLSSAIFNCLRPLARGN